MVYMYTVRGVHDTRRSKLGGLHGSSALSSERFQSIERGLSTVLVFTALAPRASPTPCLSRPAPALRSLSFFWWIRSGFRHERATECRNGLVVALELGLTNEFCRAGYISN